MPINPFFVKNNGGVIQLTFNNPESGLTTSIYSVTTTAIDITKDTDFDPSETCVLKMRPGATRDLVLVITNLNTQDKRNFYLYELILKGGKPWLNVDTQYIPQVVKFGLSQMPYGKTSMVTGIVSEGRYTAHYNAIANPKFSPDLRDTREGYNFLLSPLYLLLVELGELDISALEQISRSASHYLNEIALWKDKYCTEWRDLVGAVQLLEQCIYLRFSQFLKRRKLNKIVKVFVKKYRGDRKDINK